ncbi:hypothetical protein HFO56_01350 [Rhizobium laguerreae]|uniref:hypothetical protein n=1 Tax=Rhizobium laguerreae TaxID=1076926 RepID=UPI001C921904|nr:hypothetical protein [Rhizobium laguerreae]MBY3151055.1 hypothetical protein [Rhizobium laguerreae]
MSALPSTFDFVDINPGVPGMAFAAKAEGGGCREVIGIKPETREHYEALFAPSRDVQQANRCDLVVVGLPFSMFAYCDGGDPAVSEPVAIAAKAAKKSSAILFRVPWVQARRLRVDADEYRSAIEGWLGAKAWDVTSAVSDDGNDLFVAAVARKKWNGREALPMSFPSRARSSVPSDAAAFMLARGYPQDFVSRYAGLSQKLVDGIVDIANARTAVSSVKAAIR